ncbi:prepilin peptidase [Telmatobacter sp. DSM 110680]|uniref:Prepilin peptidase n=1 Tax=Telmatobacter sp. DSM 110680 TaxID=3036704 RepID=A0AAU7DHK1_9BACT
MMIRIVGTILAGLLGLAFGSFLNVCLSRWPEGESVVKPRSHCRNCGRTLAWWENIPLVSWTALRGRCRTCKTKISWRYPLVELFIGTLWSWEAWHTIPSDFLTSVPAGVFHFQLYLGLSRMFFFWILVALAVLDLEHLWLPDFLTWPAIIMGVILNSFNLIVVVNLQKSTEVPISDMIGNIGPTSLTGVFAAPVAAAAVVLFIRWMYRLVRKREGIGLGDAKLMAMLGAWLGLSGALLSFALGIMLGAAFAMVLLAVPESRRGSDTWLLSKLPLGTFLCVGGIVSALWGQPLIAAYLRFVGVR